MSKHRLKRSVLLACCAVASLGGHAVMAAGCAPGDARLAGHYYLEGVMEVGSEILLRSDGSFDYMLAYGAEDQVANGCWSRSGEKVSLVSAGSMFKSQAFKRMELQVNAEHGLVADMGNGMKGTYVSH
jgi:hypothetical protein